MSKYFSITITYELINDDDNDDDKTILKHF